MSRGTYIHTSRPSGMAFDGVPEGSSTKLWACESRELGLRALHAIRAENVGDMLDRFFVVRDREKEASR